MIASAHMIGQLRLKASPEPIGYQKLLAGSLFRVALLTVAPGLRLIGHGVLPIPFV
ncbi:MAG: hypothetical protein NWF14_00125 [Candidatus Bathyarchaeota archaeon]|nr:hypothetical protein [Candidatus Bathyarchaeota archaeon]